jgi:hypothetical protein
MSVLEDLSPPKRIVVIEPPYFRLFGYKRWHYPFTLVLIATYLKELGHKAVVLDLDKPTKDCREYTRTEAGDNYYRYEEVLNNRKHAVWEDIRKRLIDLRPEVVCIAQSISAKVDSADIIAEITKGIFGKKVLTVLGGTHVNAMLNLYPDYEFGENYDAVVTHVPRLIDRKPNKKLLIDYDGYSSNDFSSIWTSSGCPNRCTFCCYSIDKKVTFRNIPSIKEEITEILDKYGRSQTIYFVDDSFISYSKRFSEITAITKEFGMKFKAGGRVLDLSLEKVENFIDNGGIQIYIGIESGSQRILDQIEKRLSIEEVIKRTRWLNDLNLPWSAFFIVGFPFETLEDLEKTKGIIDRIQPTFVSINRFTPYPGTKIYKEFYMNSNIRFRDLFQQNRVRYTEKSREIEDYIEFLFRYIDEHNKRSRFRKLP